MEFYSLGVMSDSHEHIDEIIIALDAFRRFGVDHIIHCGDIGSADAVRYFADFKTTFVFGNNDFDKTELAEAVAEIGGVIQEQPVCLDWHGKSVFFVHGHDGGIEKAENAFRSGDWDIVCHGHTHNFREERGENGALLLNPGALQNGEFCVVTADLSVRTFDTDEYLDEYLD